MLKGSIILRCIIFYKSLQFLWKISSPEAQSVWCHTNIEAFKSRASLTLQCLSTGSYEGNTPVSPGESVKNMKWNPAAIRGTETLWDPPAVNLLKCQRNSRGLSERGSDFLAGRRCVLFPADHGRTL